MSRGWELAAGVVDPELPMLTIEDLGVLRAVEIVDARVDVAITPTYLGCPAVEVIRDDIVNRFRAAGFEQVTVTVVLDPPWSSDWITDRGRRALTGNGLSAPGAVRRSVSLSLGRTRRIVVCPRCGSSQTRLASEFGPTACTALYRCEECREPFEHVKEI